jgi:hypothetical protein
MVKLVSNTVGRVIAIVIAIVVAVVEERMISHAVLLILVRMVVSTLTCKRTHCLRMCKSSRTFSIHSP